jgi:hypothetical protein
MSASRTTALAALVLACSIGGCGANGAKGATESTVRLARGAHPLARPDLDQGPLDPARRIENLSLVFRRTAAQQADIDALLTAQLDPSSPSYHQWLTPEQYATRFGAQRQDIDRASGWLAQQGLDVSSVSRLGTRVSFSGRVADLQSAFQTEMHRYKVGADLHYAMARAPAIPGDLADVVLAVHNSHDFYARPMVHRVLPVPDYKSGNRVGLGPADWAAAYDVTKLYTTGVSGTPIDGTGISIAIVGVAEIAPSDVDAFRTTFGLPAKKLNMTLVPNTGAAAAGQQGSGSEAILDVEWSGGIAKGATIQYVYTGANDGNVDDATYYAIEQNLAPILSESWGGCEQGYTPSDADVLQVYGSAANVMGITYLAAAGDTGGAECIQGGPSGLYADMPAVYPGVTAVGGTEFPTLPFDSNSDVTGYSTTESVWNEGGGAGGGGISNVFARPSYQSAIATCAIVGGLPTSVNPSTMRQYPDISAVAGGPNSPFIECSSSGFGGDCNATGGSPRVSGISGTSASTPALAGVVALIAQATGGGPLGNINPLLYTIAQTTPSAFHDITQGDNTIGCTIGTDPGCSSNGTYGFAATTGYDCATGIGSVDAYNLVSAWAALAPTTTAISAMPTMTSVGASVTLTGTVAVPAPNADVLTGSVAFAFRSYTADAGFDLSWTLGAGTITGGTTSGGMATWSGAIPPGLVDPSAQYVDLVAMYPGDAHHLASTSPTTRISFSAFSFSVSPATSMVAPGGHVAFTSMGGVAPIRWYVGTDTTCDVNYNCSTIDVTTGAFVGGPVAGQAQVFALDSQGAEARAVVYTTGMPDAGPVVDSGTDAGDAAVAQDSGTASDGAVAQDAALMTDGAADDGGAAKTATGGCACNTAGERGSRASLLGGVALGLVALARRRKRST